MSNIQATTSKTENRRDLWNPPGGILVWLFVLAELLFFGFGFFMLARFRHSNATLFADGQTHLSLKLGLFLTIALLTSGWQLAEFVHNYFNEKLLAAKLNFSIAFAFGLVFLIGKSVDFYHKINEGLVLGTNDFWDFYWLFTGFHFLHILLGMIILAFVHIKLIHGKLEDRDFAIRGSANFWHMCDVIWLFMFPLFFLGKS